MREWLWLADEVADATLALAHAARLPVRDTDVPPAAWRAVDGDAAGQAIEDAARAFGLQAEAVDVDHRDVRAALAHAAPLLVPLATGQASGFAAVLGARRGALRVVSRDGDVLKVDAEAIAAPLRAVAEREAAAALAAADSVPARRRARAREALADALVGDRRVATAWRLRVRPDASITTLARAEGLIRAALPPLGAHLAEYGIFIAGWWLLGRLTLGGSIEPAWLIAWALLFGAWAPLRSLMARADNALAIRLGALIRRRILTGALHLAPDRARQMGIGQTLGRALEADALENLAVAGGIMAVTSFLDLAAIGVILSFGAAPRLHLAVLAASIATAALLLRRYHRARRVWTARRLRLTVDLIEQVAGHRTRLAQDANGEQADREDRGLARYHDAAVTMDRWNEAIAMLPRVWFISAVLALAPAFAHGGPQVSRIAISVGGIILASRALFRISLAAEPVSRALIAWRRLTPFLQARGRETSGIARLPAGREGGGSVLVARGLGYRYAGARSAVFRGVGLEVRANDRLLLEGPSGGGKSTLAAVLAGDRTPTEGLLLLHGHDRSTAGDAQWRRRVTYVPQFHDNHIVLGSLAFNLLMGRDWPPSASDLEAAEKVCHALGLGPLLDRMPGGLFQLLGETGWQLSHGEKSRIYIARALLQDPDVLVLDESFAALDPETLQACAAAVRAHRGAVLVIAHP